MQLEVMIPQNTTLDKDDKEFLISYINKCKEIRFLSDLDEGSIFAYDGDSYDKETKVPEVPSKALKKDTKLH